MVPSRGQSGGLALFWKRELYVSISSYSHHHIDAIIDQLGTHSWRFTRFNYSPTRARQRAAWDILRVLNTHHQLPWLCGGDFNELLWGYEK